MNCLVQQAFGKIIKESFALSERLFLLDSTFFVYALLASQPPEGVVASLSIKN